MPLKTIGLSLSLACEADCLYCPTDRGARIVQKMMPLALVRRIVDEVASESFGAHHAIERFTVSSNGDAFLNKAVIDALRYIRRSLPKVDVTCFTSFRRCTPDLSRIILAERLVDGFICTLNGRDQASSEVAKHVEYSAVRENLLAFLELRRELRAPAYLLLQVITARQYIDAVRRTFGALPAKLVDPAHARLADDYRAIRREWMQRLDPSRDGCFRCGTFGWAERQLARTPPTDYAKYTCPEIERVKDEALIAPDGSWYACCLDSKNELVFGNVNEQSLDQIYTGASRLALIDRLERRQFDEIGDPCSTVKACQALNQGFELKAAMRTIIGPGLSAGLSRFMKYARMARQVGAGAR
jgi:hypothetical protein